MTVSRLPEENDNTIELNPFINRLISTEILFSPSTNLAGFLNAILLYASININSAFSFLSERTVSTISFPKTGFGLTLIRK